MFFSEKGRIVSISAYRMSWHFYAGCFTVKKKSPDCGKGKGGHGIGGYPAVQQELKVISKHEHQLRKCELPGINWLSRRVTQLWIFITTAVFLSYAIVFSSWSSIIRTITCRNYIFKHTSCWAIGVLLWGRYFMRALFKKQKWHFSQKHLPYVQELTINK